ncbi:hypothetical protein EYC80_006005 [Monilinia laxa]|uniref:CFEM domain-containing protein n=1 Tax=Monilinia laxa TaxID=61186 RepID=A0A5N6KG15_MONLA|nr:hypothetical protein EYC80_006005 [Monilinia laxa]
MKTNFIAFTITTVLAGLTSAQNGLPTCAQSCVTQYTSGSQIAGCANLDIACICSNDSFLSGIACCLAAACEAADEQIAVAYAQNLCKTSGVTDLPSMVSCAATATPTASGSAGTATGPAPTGTSGTNTTLGTSTATGPKASSSGNASVTSGKTSPTATSNSVLQYEIGLGAGLLAGVGAMIALLFGTGLDLGCGAHFHVYNNYLVPEVQKDYVLEDNWGFSMIGRRSGS